MCYGAWIIGAFYNGGLKLAGFTVKWKEVIKGGGG